MKWYECVSKSLCGDYCMKVSFGSGKPYPLKKKVIPRKSFDIYFHLEFMVSVYSTTLGTFYENSFSLILRYLNSLPKTVEVVLTGFIIKVRLSCIWILLCIIYVTKLCLNDNLSINSVPFVIICWIIQEKNEI